MGWFGDVGGMEEAGLEGCFEGWHERWYERWGGVIYRVGGGSIGRTTSTPHHLIHPLPSPPFPSPRYQRMSSWLFW